MNDTAHNKFGFVLRQLERRLSALEARLGMPTAKNLLNTDRPERVETKETTTDGPRTER